MSRSTEAIATRPGRSAMLLPGAVAFLASAPIGLVLAGSAGALDIRILREQLGSAAQPTFVKPEGILAICAGAGFGRSGQGKGDRWK